MKVDFYSLDNNINSHKFVVIQARYKDSWIFVRHKDRNTWEIAGGHIEDNEDVGSAAERELYEETGAIDYQLKPICDYSVERDGDKSYGRLYFAEVYELSDLKYEIEEISLLEEIPDNLTYSQIQSHLFKKVVEYLKSNDEDII